MLTSKFHGVRWVILSLLFAATTINYLDRILFSVLAPEIRKDMHLNNETYGYLMTAFEVAYTVGFLLMGKFIDRFGTKIGYVVSLAWWSVAAVLHSIARAPLDLGMWRALLGLGEAGNFPAAIKSVAEWFPKKDRAFATGIFNAGTNVASMVGPPLFVWMNIQFGWRASFFITGSAGLLWLLFWLALYRLPHEHPNVTKTELDYIQSDPERAAGQPTVGWLQALKFRETWGFALGKFLSDPVWRFYSYWLPLYLYDVRGFDMKQVGWALPVIYLMADIGSVAGGWVSGGLMRRGYAVGTARKMALAMCAVCMPISAMAVLVPSPIVAIALMCLATAAHQGWSANLFTTTSDVFPSPAVASVTGIGGCGGGCGSVLFAAFLPGIVIQRFGYTPVFLTMGTFHLTALLCVHLLLRDMKPLRSDRIKIG